MTTLTGTGVFSYEGAGGQFFHIIYSDVTMEAISVSGNQAINPVPPGSPVGFNLFKIYVTQSTADSFIAISQYIVPNQHLTPYTGSVSYTSVDTSGNAPYAVNLPYGAVQIGVPNGGNGDPSGIPAIPLTSSFGVQPAPESGFLRAGIEVAAVGPDGTPNNFGNFLVGGTVFGQVYFGGNVNEFYAGAIMTGVTTGGRSVLINQTGVPTSAPTAAVVPTLGTGGSTTTGTANPPIFANFSVAGDLKELVTIGPVGTDGAGPANLPTYVTDFAGTVGGTLGEMHVGNAGQGGSAAFAGSLTVAHDQTIAAGVAPTLASPAGTPANPFYNPGDYRVTHETETIYNKALEDPATTDTSLGTLPVYDVGAYIGAEFGYGEAYLRNDATALVTLPDGVGVTLPTDPQILGTGPILGETTGLPIRDVNGNLVYGAAVAGELQGTSYSTVSTDAADWYAMGFQAGQTFDAQLNVGVNLNIYDPDGRLIASNIESALSAIQVTADRPGLYYFEVTEPTPLSDVSYDLFISNTGDLGAGGVKTGSFFSDVGYDSALVVKVGDLGALAFGGSYYSLDIGPTLPNNPALPLKAFASVGVNAGSLRSFTGANIGLLINNVLSGFPYVNIPFGGLGLFRAFGVGDLESQFDLNVPNAGFALGAVANFVTNTANATAVGGNIQVVDVAGLFGCDLAVNGGIGTIHAGSMATDPASFIDVNADNKGNDGIIDLIDVPGDFGTAASGGPAFVTNDGGEIRYMKLGGNIFRDNNFGGLIDEPVTGLPGAAMTFTDQAGNKVTVTPYGPVVTAAVAGTTTTVTTGPQITMTLYPIRDKAGEVPVALSSTQSMEISALGTAGNNAEVDVATVTVTGTGRAIVAAGATDAYGNSVLTQDDATGTVTGATAGLSSTAPSTGVGGSLIPSGGAQTDATNLFLLLDGQATINVLGVAVSGSAVAVQNATKGEIVGLTAPNIGTIQTVGNLGYATAEATPAAVMPRSIIAGGNSYPYVQQHTGVVIGSGLIYNAALVPQGGYLPGTGNVINVLVGGAVANLNVGGTLQALVANYGRHAPPGQVDGINGPILANRILNVNIGQGIGYNGSGQVGQDGLFAASTVGVVSNAGNPGANIRGAIVGGEQAVRTATVDGEAISTVAIDAINLFDGSLIDAHIVDVLNANFIEISDLGPAGYVSGLIQSPFAKPYNYDIGSITVGGTGGIIGTDIAAEDVGPIVSGGFGILYSEITASGLGRIETVIAGGYGIRNTFIGGGGYIGPVTAAGNGSLLPVTAFPIDVRPSDVGNELIDPNFGFYPTTSTDLDAALGITGANRPAADVTDTGVIEDDTFETQQDFAGLTANRVRTALPEVSTVGLPGTPTPNIPEYGTTYINNIFVGGTMGLLRVFNIIDGLQIVAGQLTKVQVHNNISRLGIAVAGDIGSVTINGNVGQTITDPATDKQVPDSYIKANGPAGTITKFTVLGSLFANVTATGRIGTMTIAGDVEGSIDAQGNVTSTNPHHKQLYSVDTLRVSGGIRDGSLSITGQVNNLIINGGLGVAGGSLTVSGGVNTLSVGADKKRRGSKLALALTVDGSVKSFNVFGEITGSVSVLGDVTKLNVTGDGTSPDAIAGPVTIGGRLYNATVANGNVDANVTVSGDIYNFTVLHGTIAAGVTLLDDLASIRKLSVIGGDLDGTVSAPSGSNLTLLVTGNVGDGTNLASISAQSGNVITVGGSVRANATLAFAGNVNSLSVGGNIEAGATVSGHPIRHYRVRGTTAGALTTQ